MERRDSEGAPASAGAAAAAFASLLWLLPCGATPALAQADPMGPAPRLVTGAEPGEAAPAAARDWRRIRPVDRVARGLLEHGFAASPTIARLADTIEHSDLIVYIKTGLVGEPGRLEFACAKPGIRYLRLTINVPDAEPRLIGSLAHELQHAAEVARAPAVTDASSLADYYRRHGHRLSGEAFCTRDAQRTTAIVLCEIAAAARR